jgi:hypothetical protein
MCIKLFSGAIDGFLHAAESLSGDLLINRIHQHTKKHCPELENSLFALLFRFFLCHRRSFFSQ